jgi:hypothetical protein
MTLIQMLPADPRFVTRGSLPAAVLCLAVTACGGGSSPTAPAPTPSSGPTVTITSAGATPRTLDVALGSRITIVNEDSVSHDMGSDPHPGHEDCPELNQIGMLTPGQRRTSGNLVEARTCGMHDHLRPQVSSLHLRITIR